jgi:serine/threonine protein kinase
MINKTVNGYTIRKLIGTGGMADLYYAENRLGIQAAIKVLKKKFSEEPSVYERFINEAKIMVTLDHPNIRKVYDIGDINGQPAILMEYLNGETLREKIETKKKIPDLQLRKYFEQCISALSYTHGKKVIHRDIKPSNIFITTDDVVKIVDFGIAKTRESISHTLTGQTLGTILYMSPEQVIDPKRVDYKTDIYSLGVTFYHALTGKVPYDISTDSEFIIQKRIVEEDIDLSSVPAYWQSILKNCLDKIPKNRADFTGIIINNPYDDTEIITKQNVVIKKTENGLQNKKLLWTFGIVGLILMIIIILTIIKIYSSQEVVVSMEEYGEAVDTVASISDTAEVNYDTDQTRTEYEKKEIKKEEDRSNNETSIEKITLDQRRAIKEIEESMVLIPGGTFMMGCPASDENDCYKFEKPAHLVTVKSFLISKFELTENQYVAFMGKNEWPSRECDRCPVDHVSWAEIQEFVDKLNRFTEIKYRLPKEVEWEFAARGGQNFRYAGSNNKNRVSWNPNNSDFKNYIVGGKAANGFGLFDMSGNVAELCDDWYTGFSAIKVNGKDINPDDYCAVRGGDTWQYRDRDYRIYTRDIFFKDAETASVGFRLAADK